MSPSPCTHSLARADCVYLAVPRPLSGRSVSLWCRGVALYVVGDPATRSKCRIRDALATVISSFTREKSLDVFSATSRAVEPERFALVDDFGDSWAGVSGQMWNYPVFHATWAVGLRVWMKGRDRWIILLADSLRQIAAAQRLSGGPGDLEANRIAGPKSTGSSAQTGWRAGAQPGVWDTWRVICISERATICAVSF